MPSPPRRPPTHDLLDRHCAAMRRLAARLVAAHDVDDVVQETMVRALERPPSGDAGAWLAAVLRNVVRLRRRRDRRRRRRESEVAVPAEQDPDPAARTPADVLAELEAGERISRALRRLADPYRSTLIARYVQERTAAEIARDEGIGEAAVRQRLKRGLDQLRIALARGDGGTSVPMHALAAAYGWKPPSPLPPLTPACVEPTAATAMGAPQTGAAAAVSLTTLLTMKATTTTTLAAVGCVILGAALVLTGPHLFGDARPAAPDGNPTDAAAAAAGTGDPSDAAAAATVGSASLGAGAARRTPLADPAAIRNLTVRIVWDDDGSRAADQQVLATREGAEPSRPGSGLEARTGTDGEVVFEGIAPGSYVVHGPFQPVSPDPLVAEIADEVGASTTIEVRIERGTTVTGRVTDREGRGIAGAELVRTGWAMPFSRVVGTTDADGRFSIPHLHGRLSLGARADGFVPSRLRGLVLGGKSAESVDFVLARADASLVVRVLGPGDEPVAEAEVGVGVFGRQSRPEPGPDGRAELVVPTKRTTGRDGVVRLGGLADGRWPLEVRAEGLAGHTETITVPARSPQQRRASPPPVLEHVVRLQQQAVIEGRVSDGDGLPLEGIRVSYGEHGHLVQAAASTPADGSYRLEGAPVGAVEVTAQSRGREVRATVETRPGGRVTTWNPTFPTTRHLPGTLRWPDGAPVHGGAVDVHELRTRRGPGPLWHDYAYTDESGAFVLDVPGAVERVRVRASAPRGFYRDAYEGALPSTSLDLVLDESQRIDSTLTGRIVGPDGEPVAGADLWYALVGQGNALGAEVGRDGRFSVSVGAGRYRLQVSASGLAERRVEFTVGGGEARDVGDVALDHPASIEVRVQGLPAGKYAFRLTDAETGRTKPIPLADGIGRVGGLAAGRYRLQVVGAGVAASLRDVTLRAVPGGGDPTVVRLTAVPGIDLTFTARTASGDPFLESGSLEVDDASGRPVLRTRTGFSSRSGEMYGDHALAPGRYVVRYLSETDDGSPVAASQELDLPAAAVGGDPVPVVLVLRPR